MNFSAYLFCYLEKEEEKGSTPGSKIRARLARAELPDWLEGFAQGRKLRPANGPIPGPVSSARCTLSWATHCGFGDQAVASAAKFYFSFPTPSLMTATPAAHIRWGAASHVLLLAMIKCLITPARPHGGTHPKLKYKWAQLAGGQWPLPGHIRRVLAAPCRRLC